MKTGFTIKLTNTMSIKVKKKILLAIIIVISVSSVKAQKSEFKEKKASILKEISETQQYMQSIINLGTLNETPIKLSPAVPLAPKPVELPKLKVDFYGLESKIRTLKWTQNVINNITIVALELDKIELSKYLNVNVEKVTIENIRFYNNKTLLKKIESDGYYKIEFPIDAGRKRVKGFDLKFLIEAKEYRNFTINNNQTTIGPLQIEDIRIKDKTITFLKKGPGSNGNFDIYVSDEEGGFYKPINSSSVTKLTEADIAYYNSALQFLNKLEIDLNKNKFKSEEQFEKYVEKNRPKEVPVLEKTELYNFDFSVCPKKVLFMVLDKEHTSEITATFSENTNENKFVAILDNKYGLVDSEGNWIVKPTYGHLQKNKHFSGFYNGITNQTVWVSANNKEIKKYGFSINENNMRVEKWYKTGEHTSTKGQGLFDAVNKKIILPLDTNNFIRLYTPYYIANKYQKNDVILQALYDFEGNLIFDFENQEVKIGPHNLISVEKNGKAFLYKYINKKAQLLTSRDYTSFYLPYYNASAEELNEKPLIQANKSKGTPCDLLTINGEIAIDGEKYSRVTKSYDRYITKDKKGIFSILDKYGKPIKTLDKNIVPKTEYSAGLLQAKNKTTGLYGYIDKKGDLAIPFTYSKATRFVKRNNRAVAFVSVVGKEGNETSYSIDVKNNVVGEKKVLYKKDQIRKDVPINAY